ncbi:MAG TPA: lysine--tRNA ligase [Vitreimonas sp.]|nr:lysine--tRNA ligase [Vitreimonas sp.]
MTNQSSSPVLQAPHWVDNVVENILSWQKTNQVAKLHVDDMKTPSGRVHTGALRGVVLHDLVAKALANKAQGVVSTYVFNDMDVMDGLPTYLNKDIYEQHMGKPLYKIPVPALEECGIDLSTASAEEIAELRSAKNFAELYAMDFVHAFRRLGCSQRLVWSHELYEAGEMDEQIRTALNSVEIARKIYQEVADYKLPEKWYPFQVICENCGKMGTTLVTDWDGEQVTYECQPAKVTWAVGCGHTSKTLPFGGKGKLLWKMDWPAHWTKLGITIEGAGKDHTSAGGSRDMANAIVTQIFDQIVPFDIPYEWILIRGAKMSSSKGVGTSAREFVELFPPQIGRFLFVNKDYNQVIDFDPKTMAIPDLYDAYDAGARIFWKQEEGDQRLARSFELSQLETLPEPHFLPRFRDVAVWMQHPEIELETKCAEIKGSPLNQLEKAVLKERIQYAKVWLSRYAPEEYQLTPSAAVPAAASSLTQEQRLYLSEAERLITSQAWQPQDLQQALFELAKSSLGARPAFEAIYLAFLGKKAGPRAAWFLLAMDPEFRKQRIELLSGNQPIQTQFKFPTLNNSAHFSFHPDFAAKYPTASVGIAIIRGVTITKSLPELEQHKAEFIQEISGLTTDAINQYPEIQAYRRMYKSMGIDWHSRRPSPEALLRRVTQGKGLYTVNTCVDAYNLVVMKHRISVGAFDLSQVQFPTQLRIAEGGEQILLLGDTESTTLKTGEVSYFDQQGPYNLDYNYRDAQRTMVTEKTTDLLINIDGIDEADRSRVEESLAETIEIIQRYCGGEVEMAGIVTAD